MFIEQNSYSHDGTLLRDVVLLLDKFARVRFFIRLRRQIKSMKIFRYCPERMTNKHIAGPTIHIHTISI